MEWYILTCDSTSHILDAQKWLFNKYAPDEEVVYIDLKNEPIESWSHNVLSKLPDDEHIIFGLDDFFPVSQIKEGYLFQAKIVTEKEELDRFELGWGASKKESWCKTPESKIIKDTCYFAYDDIEGALGIDYLRFGKETPYSVSCQFSIWKTSSLKKALSQKRDPWQFETQCKLDKVGCFESDNCVFSYIEESAISERQRGKINVLGLKHKDVDELVDLGFLDRKKIIYSWKNLPFRLGLAGIKYKKSYE
jgi:hypothetical protein